MKTISECMPNIERKIFNDKGQMIFVLFNGNCCKRVKWVNRLRVPEGWSFDKRIMNYEWKQLRVLDDKNNLYTCSRALFKMYAIEIQRGGYEPQLTLPMNYWNIEPYKKESSETKTDK